MKTATSEFKNRWGDTIFVKRWLCDDSATANVFIIHGMGEHCGRYVDIAEYLVERGFHVHAIDHTGHGHSEGLRGYIDDFGIFVGTAADFISKTKAEYPAGKQFVIGHSMGGLITSNMLIHHPDLVDGAILSGPALVFDDAVGPIQRCLMTMVAKLFPKAPVFQLDANLICRDPQVVADYCADPLVYSGKIRARLLTEIVAAAEETLTRAAEITLPMLFLHGEKDALADAKGSSKMHGLVGSSDKQIIIYPKLYHEIFNEEGKLDIYKTVADWLSTHSGNNE